MKPPVQLQSHPQRQHSWLVLVGVLLFAGVGGIYWWMSPPTTPSASEAAAARKSSAALRTPDLQEPAEDFSTFRYVLRSGGCELTRPVAIAWLDRHARELTPLPQGQVTEVMTMIREGGHASWPSGYRQHLFNSAFNALHICHVGEAFTRQLVHLALNDADRTMRLYAIQHLAVQRRIGHLAGDLAEEIRSALETLARQPGEEVSGGAILLLASWDSPDGGDNDTTIQQLALATAADRTRPVDIRVTAIHAAGSTSLPLARTLAADASSPVLLRKAAIASIGRYGSNEDLVLLADLQTASSRIAQAADPASKAVQARLSNSSKPAPVPY